MAEPSPPRGVTRVALVKSAARAEPLAEALGQAGFTLVLVSPFVREDVLGADDALRAALASRPEWVAVTSPGAAPTLGRVGTAGARVAAVGAGTATALASAGTPADVVGDAGEARMVERMRSGGLASGSAVVHACAEDGRDALDSSLEASLARLGVSVVNVPVYRIAPDPVGERAVVGDFDVVVVGSPGLAQRAAELFDPRPPSVAVGRATASALRDAGWTPAAVAARATPRDVVRAVEQALGVR